MPTQYRVTYKRAGREPRRHTCGNLGQLRRFLFLLGSEPWRGFSPDGSGNEADPDELVCCSGYECECGGLTWREQSDARREELKLTPLQWVKVAARPIARYQPIEWPEAVTDALALLQLRPDEPDALHETFTLGAE
jgi:hypothetical protein